MKYYQAPTDEDDSTPKLVTDPDAGDKLNRWRSPLINGAVADFFERAFEWEGMTYQFYPYFWTHRDRWEALQRATAGDPVFEQFIRAESAMTVVPVRPGYERAMMMFLRTGLIGGGGYLPLFDDPEVMDIYCDVGLRSQIDPPQPIGEPWEIRLPTSMVMLQQGDTLPVLPTPTPPPANSRQLELTLGNSAVPF